MNELEIKGLLECRIFPYCTLLGSVTFLPCITYIGWCRNYNIYCAVFSNLVYKQKDMVEIHKRYSSHNNIQTGECVWLAMTIIIIIIPVLCQSCNVLDRLLCQDCLVVSYVRHESNSSTTVVCLQVTRSNSRRSSRQTSGSHTPSFPSPLMLHRATSTHISNTCPPLSS